MVGLENAYNRTREDVHNCDHLCLFESQSRWSSIMAAASRMVNSGAKLCIDTGVSFARLPGGNADLIGAPPELSPRVGRRSRPPELTAKPACFWPLPFVLTPNAQARSETCASGFLSSRRADRTIVRPISSRETTFVRPKPSVYHKTRWPRGDPQS